MHHSGALIRSNFSVCWSVTGQFPLDALCEENCQSFDLDLSAKLLKLAKISRPNSTERLLGDSLRATRPVSLSFLVSILQYCPAHRHVRLILILHLESRFSILSAAMFVAICWVHCRSNCYWDIQNAAAKTVIGPDFRLQCASNECKLRTNLVRPKKFLLRS